MNALRIIVLLALLLPAVGTAEFESRLRDAGSLGAIRLAGSEDPAISKVYIVQLKTPAAADYHAALATAATKPGQLSGVKARFDKSSPLIESYTGKLRIEQDRVLGRAGPDATLVYRYQYGLNGFAARMHPSQAHKLENLPVRLSRQVELVFCQLNVAQAGGG